MKMKRIIKITESQLRETEGEAFKYLDTTDDTKPFNGQSVISAQGKLDGENNAEPIFTDRIGKQRTPQSWARYRAYGNLNMYPHKTKSNFINDNLDEGVSINSSIDNDKETNTAQRNGVDQFTQDVVDKSTNVETLSNDDPMDNLAAIPQSVTRCSDILINSMNQYQLTPKQIAMVIDKIQEAFPQVGNNSEFVKSMLRQQIDPNSIHDTD